MRPRSKKIFYVTEESEPALFFYRDIWGSFLKENQTKIVYGRTYLYTTVVLKNQVKKIGYLRLNSSFVKVKPYSKILQHGNQGPRWVKLSKKIIGG